MIAPASVCLFGRSCKLELYLDSGLQGAKSSFLTTGEREKKKKIGGSFSYEGWRLGGGLQTANCAEILNMSRKRE